jgi:hypothetical protein
VCDEGDNDAFVLLYTVTAESSLAVSLPRNSTVTPLCIAEYCVRYH